MRIVQISDTHISASDDVFAHNRAAITAWLHASPPDLIINTGDISMNGVIAPADLWASSRWHDSLPAPVLAVPGNHDIGDLTSIRADQAISDNTIELFESVIGPQCWYHDIPGWRLIGLNGLLFGSGHAAEEAQFQWLEASLDVTKKIALFLHKPLFIDQRDEPDRGYWTVQQAPRQRLLGLLAGHEVGLVASGHLHQSRHVQVDNTQHVWGPSAAFVVGDRQEPLGGERVIGVVVHTFTDAVVTSELIQPAGVENTPIEPFHERLYPDPHPAPDSGVGL